MANQDKASGTSLISLLWKIMAQVDEESDDRKLGRRVRALMAEFDQSPNK